MKTWLVRKQVTIHHYVQAETKAYAELLADFLGDIDANTITSKWRAQPITNPKHSQYTS